MSQHPDGPAGQAPSEAERPSRAVSPSASRAAAVRHGVRVELPPFVACLAAGVVLGGLWRLLWPLATGPGDTERAVSSDGILAGLGVLAGILTAALFLVRSGPAPARRFGVVLVGTIVGSGLAWAVGMVLGTPSLRAVGAAFLWPLATAGVTFAATGIAVFMAPTGPGVLGSGGSPLVGTGGPVPGDPGAGPPGQEQQVSGREFHVEAPPPGADQDRREA